jgi:DNA polymerase-3 subunit epsilon
VKVDRREVAAALLPGVALAAAVALALGIVAATLDATGRSAWWALLEPRMALIVFMWLMLSAAAGALLRAAYLRWVRGTARLAEEAQVLLQAQRAGRTAGTGGGEVGALARAIEQLAAQRDALRDDMAAQVSAASRGVELERNRLAALMAELTQSVVVCNLDGRIGLYNNRARLQFRALSAAPTLADGAELIGLGRSIYAVLDRALIAHAMESVQQRLARGAAHPAAQVVTATRSGQLLRVQVAPVREAGGDALEGFVLMLDNITRDFAAEAERDRLLHALDDGSRRSLGNVQAALEMLDFPDLDGPTRERFMAVVRDEVASMSRRLQDLGSNSLKAMKARWPLEDMLAGDLVAAACRRIEAAWSCRAAAADIDAGLWLQVDSYSLLQALVSLAGRLVEEKGVRALRLRIGRAREHAQLDLIWPGAAISTETVIGWETEPIRVGTDRVALTVRDVVERHGGEFWFERDRARQEAFFRMLLPLAAAGEPLEAAAVVRGASRPEVYDFDLFRPSPRARDLGGRTLAELSYTVFDTETTGLDPAAGDEIIQIGATRIVAAKLRREDCFEQLVDPGRSLPSEGIAIHGITPEMLRGAPGIAAVLPAFHAYAADTVLVAHNAAFDLRFFELKARATGVRFDQPVLDTLLLSAVVHPAQDSHRLEAIAERLGVPVLGRHTALGDAIVTAEVFMKLLPLLAEKGIHTLAQAIDASQRSHLARVKY